MVALFRLLADVYQNLGPPEWSVHYCDELAGQFEAAGDAEAAFAWWLQAARIYHFHLSRPREAAHYYRRALQLGQTSNGSTEMVRENLRECEARSEACELSYTLFDLLLSAAGKAARTLAARMAMAADYNLWRFDPFSFCAWYERAFGGGITHPLKANSSVPVWSLTAIYQMLDLGRFERGRRKREEAEQLFQAALVIADRFDIPQGQYLAYSELAVLHGLAGNLGEHRDAEARAKEIKRRFDQAAAKKGISRATSSAGVFAYKQDPKGEIPPWAFFGLHLVNQLPGHPEVQQLVRSMDLMFRTHFEFMFEYSPVTRSSARPFSLHQ